MACDKPTPDPSESSVALRPTIDPTARPTLLYHVFGSREFPKAVPIAALVDGTLTPIVLSDAGWRQLDSLAFASGTRLSIYRDGGAAGEAEVTRGMWPADSAPLYAIRGCRSLVPQAAVQLRSTVPTEESVEFLGSSVPLPQSGATTAAPVSTATSVARPIADSLAQAADIGPEDIKADDFHARWLRTGVGTSGHTLLISQLDPNAGDEGPGAGNTAHLFALADETAGKWLPTYAHAAAGAARAVEFQRLVSHADLTGDGVSEIVVEAWRYAATPDLVVLRWQEGKWREHFRLRQDWCLQQPKQ